MVDTINEWDKGYPSGGNYWSDYEGNDIKSGVYQNETGYDWIGDSQYVIDQNNSDRYPLMYPFIPEMEEIRISYRSLLLKYTEMNSTLHKQIGNITDLQEQIDSLNSTLQTSIDNLQDQIDSLNSTQTSSKEAIIDELSTIKNLMYVFIAATVILIATTVYLAIRKPKLISKTKAKKKG